MGSEDNDRERMRDIIERLELQAFVAEKIQSGMKPLIMDCLNEITRLRAEHKMAFEAVGDVVKANDDLRAENETLRRDVKTAVMGDSAELADVKRENEKLKAILIELADEYEQFAYEGAEIALLREARAAAAIRESDNGSV